MNVEQLIQHAEEILHKFREEVKVCRNNEEKGRYAIPIAWELVGVVEAFVRELQNKS